MPELNFEVERAEPVPHAASPLLYLKLKITDVAGLEALPIPAVALRCQIRIEPTRRKYVVSEQQRLLDLFGEPARWGQTLRSMLWTHTSLIVPPFTTQTVVDLPVPCTYDFNLAATKYFYALEDGDVPLCLLFSGTIFSAEEEDGPLQATPISWEKEADFRLPVQAWKAMMDHYYPNIAWLCLRQDVFDQLYLFKSRLGLSSWEQALERLLDASREQVEP
ncbi:DUF6084 family protein [Isosphaeraceae bacterium EP7]